MKQLRGHFQPRSLRSSCAKPNSRRPYHPLGGGRSPMIAWTRNCDVRVVGILGVEENRSGSGIRSQDLAGNFLSSGKAAMSMNAYVRDEVVAVGSSPSGNNEDRGSRGGPVSTAKSSRVCGGTGGVAEGKFSQGADAASGVVVQTDGDYVEAFDGLDMDSPDDMEDDDVEGIRDEVGETEVFTQASNLGWIGEEGDICPSTPTWEDEIRDTPSSTAPERGVGVGTFSGGGEVRRGECVAVNVQYGDNDDRLLHHARDEGGGVSVGDAVCPDEGRAPYSTDQTGAPSRCRGSGAERRSVIHDVGGTPGLGAVEVRGGELEIIPIPIASIGVGWDHISRQSEGRGGGGRIGRSGPRAQAGWRVLKDVIEDAVIEGSLRHWLLAIQEQGYSYNGLTPTPLLNDGVYSCRVRMNCVESRRKPRCSVDVVAWRLRQRSAWRVTVRSWDGVFGHSHPPYIGSRASIRQSAMFAHLSDIERAASELPTSVRVKTVARGREKSVAPFPTGIPIHRQSRSQAVVLGGRREREAVREVHDMDDADEIGVDVIRDVRSGGPLNAADAAVDAPVPSPSAAGRGVSAPVIHISEHAAVSESVGEALRVVARCHDADDSVGLLESLRHVSESFGYRIRVRRSEYVDASPLKCLRSATLECPEMKNNVRCKFQCKVTGILRRDERGHDLEVEGGSTGDGGRAVGTVRHDLQVGVHAHNHAPSNKVMRDAIPVEANAEHVSCDMP